MSQYDDAPLSTAFIRNMCPFMHMLAATFDVPANQVLAAASKMEELGDFKKVVQVLGQTKMPGKASYKIRPYLNEKGVNKDLVNGMVFTLILDGTELMQLRFLDAQVVLAGPGFVLINTSRSDCTLTKKAARLSELGFGAKLYLYQALTGFPKVADKKIEQLRERLIKLLSFDNFYDYDFAPGLVGAMEVGLYMLDAYHRTAGLSYAGRWRHDVMSLPVPPKGKLLDDIFSGTEAFFQPIYQTSHKQQRIVGMRFRIALTSTIYFDIIVGDDRVDLDLQFATFSTQDDAAFFPDLAGELVADLSAENRAVVYARACRLVDAIEVVTKRKTKCESVRRALKLFLTVGDTMEAYG